MVLVGGSIEVNDYLIESVNDYVCSTLLEVNIEEYKALFLVFYSKSNISNIENMSRDRSIFDSYTISHDNLVSFTWRNGDLKSIDWKALSTNQRETARKFSCG